MAMEMRRLPSKAINWFSNGVSSTSLNRSVWCKSPLSQPSISYAKSNSAKSPQTLSPSPPPPPLPPLPLNYRSNECGPLQNPSYVQRPIVNNNGDPTTPFVISTNFHTNSSVKQPSSDLPLRTDLNDQYGMMDYGTKSMPSMRPLFNVEPFSYHLFIVNWIVYPIVISLILISNICLKIKYTSIH